MLPIDAIKGRFLSTLADTSVVISAPTGSGKSTQVPRWCPGKVLVVEPRRVACRSLAKRVAELEDSPLGERVGYQVRDENRRSAQTKINFVTPGIALQIFEQIDDFETIILDEFHERTLQVDLLLALLRQKGRKIVVMSATLQAERLAEALSATHIEAEGRTYPVEVKYSQDGQAYPSGQYLASRVKKCILKYKNHPGDILVFLPGKGEISAAAKEIKDSSLEVIPLHGQLSMEKQNQAFATSGKKKVILSTNVAETSVTVPGVQIVIDSGLVRRTQYFQGRGALTLTSIARDSAEQRAGRAGRMSAGLCHRLWQSHGHLKDHTPPEIYRESLTPLVLASLACGSSPRKLPFLDAPKAHALDAAIEELTRLGAVDAKEQLTEVGQELFRLPLDPWLARLLIEAQNLGCLSSAIDLVALLSVRRSAFLDSFGEIDEEDPRHEGCDLSALLNAFQGQLSCLHPQVRSEALQHRRRLHKMLSISGELSKTIDRKLLLKAIVRADPQAAYIKRTRKRHTAWAGGGTEIELDRRSALQLVTKDPERSLPEAMVVLAIRVQSDGPKNRIYATYAAPVNFTQLAELGLGSYRYSSPRWHRGRVKSVRQLVFAQKVLLEEEASPQGEALREALADLIQRGTAFKGVTKQSQTILKENALAIRLAGSDLLNLGGFDLKPLEELPKDSLEWFKQRLNQLGVESEEDPELLEAEDLLPPTIPDYLLDKMREQFPLEVSIGKVRFEVQYLMGKRQALLHAKEGKLKSPPPRQYLPRFAGFKVLIQAGGTFHQL